MTLRLVMPVIRSIRPSGRLTPDHVGNRVLAAVMRNRDDYRHIWVTSINCPRTIRTPSYTSRTARPGSWLYLSR